MALQAPREDALDWLRRCLLIRRFEECAIRLSDAGHIREWLHLGYVGQETTGVPSISLLGKEDYLFTAHRNSGHLLARGADPGRLLAEILGRAGGYNGGKGGSYHVADLELGVPSTSAIVGANVALANGTAFASKAKGASGVTMCMIGESVPEEGSFFESVNMAALWSLPVVYVLENNSGGVKTSTLAVSEIYETVRPFGIPASAVDGTDVQAVFLAARKAVERARRGEGPSLIEARTGVPWAASRILFRTQFRVLTKELDVRFAWDRSLIPEEYRDWYDTRDGLVRFIRDLLDAGYLTRDQITEMDNKVIRKIEEAERFALESPWPQPEAALTGVFPPQRP